MTVGEWLHGRTPPAPEALRVRLDEVLGAAAAGDAAGTTHACVAAAERLVEDLMRRDCTTRESALDLLAADALMTYAFESASKTPSELVQRATETMSRIAALGAMSSHRGG